jgi:hypothetical protein
MQGIPVRYNLALAIVMLVLGIIVLVLGLMVGKGLQLLIGGLNIGIGIAYLTQPWFVVFEDRIEIRNLLGMTMKTHTISSLAELEVREKKVYRIGEARPLRGAGGFLARSDDIAAVQVAILQSRG